jgi:hypothetical protein
MYSDHAFYMVSSRNRLLESTASRTQPILINWTRTCWAFGCFLIWGRETNNRELFVYDICNVDETMRQRHCPRPMTPLDSSLIEDVYRFENPMSKCGCTFFKSPVSLMIYPPNTNGLSAWNPVIKMLTPATSRRMMEGPLISTVVKNCSVLE